MDIDKLKTFCLLMELKTLPEVSKVTRLSTSGVQKQITALEKELGHKLFMKQKKNLKPTIEGENFYRSSLKLIEDYEEALKNLKKISHELTGTFVINSTPSAIGSWLLEDLKDFIQHNSQVQFIFLGDDSPIENLMNQCDVFIRPSSEVPPLFEKKNLRRFSGFLYATKEYFSSRPLPEKPEDLKNYRIIAHGTERQLLRQGINWHLDYLPRGFQNILYVNSSLGVLKAIENSLGIGIATDFGIEALKNDVVKVLPNLRSKEVEICIVYAKDSLKIQHINMLYDCLIKRYG